MRPAPAVRVRPFNQREKDAGATLVVDMAGNQTFIKKPKTNEEPKKFAFGKHLIKLFLHNFLNIYIV